jgi:hypothetical protein
VAKYMSEHYKMMCSGLDRPDDRDPAAVELADLSAEISTSPAFRHIIDFLLKAKAFDLDVTDPAVIRKAVAAGEAAYAAATALEYVALKVSFRSRISIYADHHPIVYYVRVGEMVKIGTTVNLARRMPEVGASGALAVEPGDANRESERHRQFAELRRPKTELFSLDHGLAGHIAEIRAKFAHEVGWSTEQWVERQKTPNTARIGRIVPDVPDSGPRVAAANGLVTASEIARIVGVTPQAIYGWRRHGRLVSVSTDLRGKPLFRLTDALRVRKSHHRESRRGAH